MNSNEVTVIFEDLGQLIKKETASAMSFEWDALIRDTDGTFASVHRSVSEGASSSAYSESKLPRIPAAGAEKIFEHVLKKMGREIKPQLNAQGEFV